MTTHPAPADLPAEVMPLPERLRVMAGEVMRNELAGATTRRLIQLDMMEAADRIADLGRRLAEAQESNRKLALDALYAQTEAFAAYEAQKAAEARLAEVGPEGHHVARVTRGEGPMAATTRDYYRLADGRILLHEWGMGGETFATVESDELDAALKERPRQRAPLHRRIT